MGQGFVIAPFFNPTSHLLTIPCDFLPADTDIRPAECSLPSSSAKEEYIREIETIKDALKGRRGKTVAARAILIKHVIDINDTFQTLCDDYPDAFVFAFSTTETGTWIGVSPELLVDKHGQDISTMALAGTRKVSFTEDYRQWDEKNIDEQRMVVEFIVDCLKDDCIEITPHKSFTKQAGGIEHICTKITATLEESGISEFEKLLSRLSPTPALCGSDRRQSLLLIQDCESFNREMYGGFCGPCDDDGDCSLFVILRCAKCNPTEVCVYAGGGITALSNAEDEWSETEMKSKTIINKLK